jgi:hypothetical protein
MTLSNGDFGVVFAGVRERLRQLGGTLKITTGGAKSLIEASLPLEPRQQTSLPSAATGFIIDPRQVPGGSVMVAGRTLTRAAIVLLMVAGPTCVYACSETPPTLLPSCRWSFSRAP